MGRLLSRWRRVRIMMTMRRVLWALPMMPIFLPMARGVHSESHSESN